LPAVDLLFSLTLAHPALLPYLQRLWAYITLAVTVFVTEEANPLIGGLAAHDGRLSALYVAMAVGIGAWGTNMLLYFLGRWRGHWVRKRWPRVRIFLLRALRVVRRHPWRSSLAVRFAYGLRLTLPLTCGAARVPILIYAVGNAISCAVWASLFTALGWGFGRTMLVLVGHVRRYEQPLMAAIIVALVIGFFIMRKRHVEDEVVDVLASGDPEPPPRIES